MAKKDTRNLLELTPAPLCRCEYNDKLAVLIVSKFRSKLGKKLGALLRSQDVRVRLDEHGTAVWEACDGRRTVGEIVDLLKQTFGEDIEPAYERVAVFIRNLKRIDAIDYLE